MSLLNVWVSPNRALVGVDTECVTNEGTRKEASKVIPIAHANLVLAGRGHVGFLNALFCTTFAVGDDFDVITERMPQILAHAHALFVTAYTASGLQSPTPLDRQEIALVGWSPKAGRMVGRTYRQHAAVDGFVAREITPFTLGPWEQVQGMPPEPSSPSVMEWIARQQTIFVRKTMPEMAIGGRLLIAELTRDNMTFTSHCKLDKTPSFTEGIPSAH